MSKKYWPNLSYYIKLAKTSWTYSMKRISNTDHDLFFQWDRISDKSISFIIGQHIMDIRYLNVRSGETEGRVKYLQNGRSLEYLEGAAHAAVHCTVAPTLNKQYA